MTIQKRLGRRTLGLAALAGAAFATTASVQGEPRTDIQPYLQIEQVLSADFNEGDVLTYTGVGGGVNATIATQRVTGTISYDYQRRIAWNDNIGDDDVHTGLASIQVQAIPNTLTVEAGAMATRSGGDLRFPDAGLRTIDDPGVAEIYSAFAGPTLSTHAGPVTIGASYRLGYVFVDDHSLSGIDFPPNLPKVDMDTSSVVHNATASVGMSPGELPFGWTVGGGWVREDTNQLDSRFEAKYVRGDVVVPVGSTLALTAGVGYEDGRGSQQDILRNLNGTPVVGPGGTLFPDKSKPRVLTYDIDGLIWDAGVIWRPGPRTELQARVGRRFGGTTFVGSFQHRINRAYSISGSVYDSVSSFGQLLVADLSGVPRNFDIPRHGVGGIGGTGGCVFGTDPGTGTCFDDSLQSINGFNFRNRGANVLLSGGRGPWNFGVGAGYSNRRYFTPPSSDFILHGVTDQSFSLSGSVGRELSRTSGVDVGAYAGWFDSGIAGVDGSFSTGVTGSYYQRVFHDRLQASLTAGIYNSQADEFDSTVGSVSFGLRYVF
ncbi:MAG TPA: hypothetical protein VF727_05080 [Allosphingosinicella sp.]|jgi:hypothetical protein